MPKKYILPVSQAELLPEALCRELFPKRMERAGHFVKKEDALLSIAAGALEAIVLSAREEDILFNEWGKPHIPGGAFFSLSHSGDYALLAVDVAELGADIQKHTPFSRKTAERVFTPEELRWMDEEAEERFFSLWTMKESVMKLDGRGFHLPPESFSVLPLMKGEGLFTDRGMLYGRTERFHDCTISVCSPGGAGDFSLRVLTARELLGLRRTR